LVDEVPAVTAPGSAEPLPRLVLAQEPQDDDNSRAETRWWGPVAERMTRSALEVGSSFLTAVLDGVQTGLREANADKGPSGTRR
jgi:hypothetical protein